MKIPFILNEERVVVDADPGERLVTILRNVFRLTGAKEGCSAGRCGSCTVLLNGKAVPSCIIPAAVIRNNKIITIEHFSTTDDYKDIITGFRQAGVQLCGFCNTGKILSAHTLIQNNSRPVKNEIKKELGNICKCDDFDILASGIMIAASLRQKRKNVRK